MVDKKKRREHTTMKKKGEKKLGNQLGDFNLLKN